MHKTIWHVGGRNNNFGDCALQVAIMKIIRERSNEYIDFVHVDTQKTFFSENLIEKINREADMLLIGGGGFIFPCRNNESGWQFNIETKNISKIKVPLAVYGIGNNKFPYDESDFLPKMWKSISAVIEKSFAFSVRNKGTFRTLESAGINTENIDIVPDAALFVEPSNLDLECLKYDGLKIGLNYATDRWDLRFKNMKKAYETLETVLYSCKEVARKYKAKIYLIEHLTSYEQNRMDKPYMRSRAKNILGEDGCILFEEANKELYPPFDYNAELFVDIYRQMDLMLGMRGHANIIAMGQETPCIGIGEHDKVDWFLDEYGLSNQLCLPLSQDKKSNKTELLKVAGDVIINIDKYKEMIRAKRIEFEQSKNVFVDRILNKLYEVENE